MVIGHLVEGNTREAWCTLGGWYKAVAGKAAKPCYQRLERQTAEREALYARVPPPGRRIPKNVDRPPQNDEAPSDAEIRAAVRACHTGRAGGGSKMRAEDLKHWLAMMETEETESGFAGRGDTWRMLVQLVQNIWETGEIPRQMLWTIMVLIPKGNSGDFRGIGLLEVIWKVLEKMIDA